jgi:hypothetical protein
MSRIENLESSRLQCRGAYVKRLFVGEIVGRLTRSLPPSRSNELPVYVARVPTAPFCKTPPGGSASDTRRLQHPLVVGDRSCASFGQLNLVGYLLQTRGKGFNLLLLP